MLLELHWLPIDDDCQNEQFCLLGLTMLSRKDRDILKESIKPTQTETPL